jgi:hypothetical protein
VYFEVSTIYIATSVDGASHAVLVDGKIHSRHETIASAVKARDALIRKEGKSAKEGAK